MLVGDDLVFFLCLVMLSVVMFRPCLYKERVGLVLNSRKMGAAKACMGSMPIFKLGYISIIQMIDLTILTGQLID